MLYRSVLIWIRQWNLWLGNLYIERLFYNLVTNRVVSVLLQIFIFFYFLFFFATLHKIVYLIQNACNKDKLVNNYERVLCKKIKVKCQLPGLKISVKNWLMYVFCDYLNVPSPIMRGWFSRPVVGNIIITNLLVIFSSCR